MRWLVVVLLAVHGLVHVFGALNGFGWAEMPRLEEPISGAMGVCWLLAALLAVATAVLLAQRAQAWWVACALAAVVSQAVILTSWSDAKAGTLANVVMGISAGYGYASLGPRSSRAEYQRRRETALPEVIPGGVVAEADLAHMPPPVADYIRYSGAVGRARVANFHATVHGRIRGGPAKAWMPFTGEQFNTYGPNPRRLFVIDATMLGLPVDVLHVFDESSATMRAKVCSVVPVVNSAGPDMDRAETVTLFNDLCVLAPAALVDAPVRWHGVDDHHVRGSFTNGAQTVTAELIFSDDHELVDFVSDDRLRASPDGKSFTQQRWSTPIHSYRDFGGRLVAVTGEARWHAPEPEGVFTYLEFNVDGISYNLSAGSPRE